MLVDLELMETQIQIFEKQDKIIGSIFGPMGGLSEMKIAILELKQGLFSAIASVQFGSSSPRTVATQIKPVEGAIGHMKRILNQAHADMMQGHRIFQKQFGK
jgi:hypothetical protein